MTMSPAIILNWIATNRRTLTHQRFKEIIIGIALSVAVVLVMCFSAPAAQARGDAMSCMPDNNGRITCVAAPASPSGKTAARKQHRARAVVDANINRASHSGASWVDSAAGPIEVSPEFAPKIVAFIAANYAAGKRFRSVHCLSFARTHVDGSYHFTGNACDFHPHPIARLAADYGLRSGCSFLVGRKGHRHPDCEHVDNGIAVAAARTRTRIVRQ